MLTTPVYMFLDVMDHVVPAPSFIYNPLPENVSVPQTYSMTWPTLGVAPQSPSPYSLPHTWGHRVMVLLCSIHKVTLKGPCFN